MPAPEKINVPPYPNPDDPGFVKPGFVTTEWWVVLLMNAVSVVSIFKPQLAGSLQSWAQPIAIGVAGILDLGYVIFRTFLKSRAHQAVAAVAVARATTMPSLDIDALRTAMFGIGDDDKRFAQPGEALIPNGATNPPPGVAPSA